MCQSGEVGARLHEVVLRDVVQHLDGRADGRRGVVDLHLLLGELEELGHREGGATATAPRGVATGSREGQRRVAHEGDESLDGGDIEVEVRLDLAVVLGGEHDLRHGRRVVVRLTGGHGEGGVADRELLGGPRDEDAVAVRRLERDPVLRGLILGHEPLLHLGARVEQLDDGEIPGSDVRHVGPYWARAILRAAELLCYRVPRPMTTRMGNTADLTLLSFHFLYIVYLYFLYLYLLYIL